jgi:hypothetical protein
LAVVAFIGPVGLDVSQLAAQMLSGAGSGGNRGTGQALQAVATLALSESRKQAQDRAKEQNLADAYVRLKAEEQKKRSAAKPSAK